MSRAACSFGAGGGKRPRPLITSQTKEGELSRITSRLVTTPLTEQDARALARIVLAARTLLYVCTYSDEPREAIEDMDDEELTAALGFQVEGGSEGNMDALKKIFFHIVTSAPAEDASVESNESSERYSSLG